MSRSGWLTDVQDGDVSHHPDSKLTDWLSDLWCKPSEHIESSQSALLNMADACIARSDLTEALPLVIQAEPIAPSSGRFNLKRAEILARQGDIEVASQMYERLNLKSPVVIGLRSISATI